MTAQHDTDSPPMSVYVPPAVSDLGSLAELTLGGAPDGSDGDGGGLGSGIPG